MTKPIFNADDYDRSDRVCIHFEKHEHLVAFYEYMDSIGRRFRSGTRYTNPDNSKKYGENTVYYFNAGTYGSLQDAIRGDVLILYGDEFDWGDCSPTDIDVELTFDQLFSLIGDRSK